MIQLSEGICARLNDANPGDDDLFNNPHTVQFLSIKKVVSPNAPSSGLDRYRIIFSDGVHFLQAMLATQLNNLVNEEAIGKNTVAVIEKLTCNFIQEKRLIIILALRVLSTTEGKIGEPQAIAAAGAAPEQNRAAVAAPAAASTSTTAPIQQQQQQQPQRNQASASKGSRTASIYPIEGLSPYQNNWTIKARVTQKSDIKTWSNQRGEGKLFSVTLMDETGEIKGTGFNTAVDDFFEKFEEGKVYYVSRARVNLAKKKFSNLTNDYELTFEKNTEVEECLETTDVPKVKYNFVQLSGLEELAKDATCDVVGIVKEVGPVGEITSKATNKTIPKRELTLVDKSGYSVRITLWGKQAEQYSATDQPVVAFKGVKVGDFGGRSLSMFSSSTMNINPDIEEAHVLRGWYDSIGAAQPFQSHSNAASGAGMTTGGFDRAQVHSLAYVKNNKLGMEDRVDYFSTRATVMHIRSENIAYPACPTQGCNKKVVENHDGWRCEKCNKSYDKPEYRYIISVAVADWSSQAWLQGFNDAGLAIFGMPANDLVEIKERSQEEYDAQIAKANCNTFNFACRAKQDSFNDQPRVRYGITRIQPLDYREEAKHLRDILQSDWAR